MLFIFDLDNTLVVTYETQPLSGVARRLRILVEQGYRLAVATNQAGLAWRVAKMDAKFPDPESLARRFLAIAEALPPLMRAPWFVAIGDGRLSLSEAAYAALVDDLRMAAEPLEVHVSARADWRKPEPGMLLAACERHQMAPSEAIYVGDVATDAEAAAAAGMDFAMAVEFFVVECSGPAD